jgi:hypothetical protein
MKAFIDRLYCMYDFGNSRPRPWSSRLAGQGRKAVIAAVCEQKEKSDMGMTLDAMRLPLTALGYEIVDEISIFGAFDRGIIREREEIIEDAVCRGRRFGASLLATTDS